jgi:preprotein translocase subunit SecF
MELIKPGRQFDFMSKRWYAIGLSLLLMVLSIGSFFYPGPRLGTDFRGGTEVEIAFSKELSAADVRAAVEHLGYESPEVVSVEDKANPHRYLIRVLEVSGLDEAETTGVKNALCLAAEGQTPDPAKCPPELRATEVRFSPGGDKISARFEGEPTLAELKTRIAGVPGVELRAGENNPVLLSGREHKVEFHLKSRGDQILDGLRTKLGSETVPATALRIEWIGPKAGAQLRDAAITAVVISIVFIMAYVALRFDLRFAPGGIVALIHDALIAAGAMILTRREITLSTLAALLTITGYSINDTVVIYDRIRENLVRHRGLTFPQIINLSVSETLGRTFITSGVTALSLIAFLWFGTGLIKDFAFCILVGMIAGTYSTIYVAAPLTEWIDRKFFGGSAQKRKVISRERAVKRSDAVV